MGYKLQMKEAGAADFWERQETKMDRDVAEKINALMYDITGRMDESVRLVMERSTPEEFSRYRQSAGKVLGYIYYDILRQIHDEYPDLIPNGLRHP